MNTKFGIVTSAADGCGKPSSIRTMDNSHRSNMEQKKEPFMLSNRSSVSHGCSIAAAAIAVGTMAMFAVGNARANLILNGNFSVNASSYTSSPGYSSYQSNPTNPTDWTVNGAGSGVNGPDAGSAVGTPFAPVSTAGVRDFNFLQGGGVYSSQTVTTTASQAYTLAFAAAQRDGNTSAVLEVILTDATNSQQITTLTPATITDTGFNNFSLNFTAPSASTAVEFLNNSPSGDNTVDVSNVSLNPVPEPATIGLVAIGSLGLLLIGRRRAAHWKA